MLLTQRQKEIVEIVKENQPIIGDEIAKKLSLTRSALRTDFSVLIGKGILKSKPKIGYVYQGTADKKFVYEIMGPVVSVESNISVYDTILQIFAKDVGSILITEEGRLVGVVSRKDLLKIAIGNKDINKIPVNIIMTRIRNIIFCEESDEIKDAVKKIIDHQIDSIPVVKIKEIEGKKFYEAIGRVTKTTITRLFLENFGK